MTLSLLNAIIDVDVAARAGWSVTDLAEAYLAGGATFLQLRAKHLASMALMAMTEDLVQRAHRAGALIILNDRADIARLAHADGVHLGQDDLEPAAARQIVGGDAILGFSTHSIEQVRAGSRLPVTYIAVGPIFGTTSKDTGCQAVGTKMVSEARAALDGSALDTPIVAIGGITLDRAASVIGAGASSVAVISDLLATGDPEARVREYLSVLKNGV